MFHTVERSHVEVAGFKLSLGPESLTCNKNKDDRKLSDCRGEQKRWGLAPSTACYRQLVKSENKFMKRSDFISFFSAGKRRLGSTP